MDTELDLREWITSELAARNWSMRELARRADISHSWISNILAGQLPTWDFCGAIAGAFGVSGVEVLLRAKLITSTDVRRALPILQDDRTPTARKLLTLVEALGEEEQKALLALLSRPAGK